MPGKGRTPLDRDRVVAAALELAEREGIEALTMRRLGRSLGVEAMSLYHYFASKERLLDAVVEAVVDSMDVSGIEGSGSWEERLKQGFRAYRQLAHEHPHVFPLVGRRPVATLAALRPVELALDILRSAGLTAGEALQAFRTLSSFAFGYALSELRGFAIAEAADRTPGPGTIDRNGFPRLAEALAHASSVDRDSEFEKGLDIIVDGIRNAYLS